MEPETAQLLAALAAKLGTTVEYLWSVLVQQGQIELGKKLGAITVSVVLLPIASRKLKKIIQYEEDELGAITWCCVAVAALITGICCFVELRTPEAWALQQILNK